MADPFGPRSIVKVIDNAGKLLDQVSELTTSDVLVGVPGVKGGRKDEPGKPVVTNVQLAYIHERGSPARNIPARPFLFPGVRKIRAQAMAMLKQGAQDVLLGKARVDVILNKVGLLARNSVVNEITDPEPPFTPLRPATIRARLRKTQAGRRQLRKFKDTQAMTQWAEEGNIHPLIDTAQLRASITYVVRKVSTKTFGFYHRSS